MLKIKEFVDAEYLFNIRPQNVWIDTVNRTITLTTDHFGEIDNEAFNFLYDLIKDGLVEKVEE